MKTQQNTRCIYFLLLEFVMRSKPEWNGVAEKHSLTVIQMYTLGLITEIPKPMNSLTTRLACDASNVTGIVDKLVHQELVDRHEDPRDRRVKLVKLTPKGSEIRDMILEEIDQLDHAKLTNLTTEELHELRRLISKLVPERDNSCY